MGFEVEMEMWDEYAKMGEFWGLERPNFELMVIDV